MSTVLVRNEQRKLLASYLNSVASATFVGGWLPPIGALVLGNGKLSADPFLLMAFAFVISFAIFSFGYRVLGGLEEPQ